MPRVVTGNFGKPALAHTDRQRGLLDAAPAGAAESAAAAGPHPAAACAASGPEVASARASHMSGPLLAGASDTRSARRPEAREETPAPTKAHTVLANAPRAELVRLALGALLGAQMTLAGQIMFLPDAAGDLFAGAAVGLGVLAAITGYLFACEAYCLRCDTALCFAPSDSRSASRPEGAAQDRFPAAPALPAGCPQGSREGQPT